MQGVQSRALELPLGWGEILKDEVETVKEREEVPLPLLSRTFSLLPSHAWYLG